MNSKAIDVINRNLISQVPFLNLGSLGLSDRDFFGGGEIDQALRKCKHLKGLTLSNNLANWGDEKQSNKLNEIPSAIQELTELQELNCSGSRSKPWGITNISFLGKLKNIERLSLNFNKICSFSGLPDLRGLKRLALRNNNIKDLGWISDFPNLTYLDIAGNEIEDITSAYQYISIRRENPIQFLFSKDYEVNFGVLNISENPLNIPPIEIATLGHTSIINYFAELNKQGFEYLYEAKILIVGQPRAGKTSLRLKLFNIESELAREHQTTRGIDIDKLEFDIIDENEQPQILKSNIWDFGGQQIYHTTHQFFLTNRSLYILVVDTGRDSIGNDDANFNYWLQIVELLGGGSPLFLVRNEKNERQITIDLPSKKARFPFLKKDFDIDLNALIQGANTFNAKRRNDFKLFVDEVKIELQRLPLVGLPMPKKWSRIRTRLQELSDTEPYISRQDYIRICKENDLTDFEKQMELSRIFHDIGVFLHFQIEVLEDIVILQNAWATDAVFAILDNTSVRQNKGRFIETDLANIWSNKGYDPSVHNKLLALMMKFEQCYQIEYSSPLMFIVPEMLPESCPVDYLWIPKNDIHILYEYDFMPKGIITRLIVRLHKHIHLKNGNQIVWKTGVVINGAIFSCLDSFAEITESWDNKNLLLKAQGPFAKELLSIIAFQIDELNDEQFRQTANSSVNRKSAWRKLIPCNCRICTNLTNKHLFEYDSLIKAQIMNKDIQCPKELEDVSAMELLEGVLPRDKGSASFGLAKRIFISYSHKDINWLEKIKNHLAPLKNQELISEWCDREIESGIWNSQIELAIDQTDIFLFLITDNFLASEYIRTVEVKRAYDKYRQGRALIFPVICDACLWNLQPISKDEKEFNASVGKEIYVWLGKFQAFPSDAKPIKNWDNPQDGFLDVVSQLKKHL